MIENSGGAGEYRGGLGIERIFEAMYDNINYTGLGDRQVYKPWGLYGGMEGAGGYGDPKNRKPEAVLSDVIEHKVSIDKAEELYGVKIEKDGSSFRLA